jgi:hypothetical protein
MPLTPTSTNDGIVLTDLSVAIIAEPAVIPFKLSQTSIQPSSFPLRDLTHVRNKLAS